MKTLWWFLIYMVALFIDTVVMPKATGIFSPFLGDAIMVTAVTMLSWGAGLWFAFLAGVVRDSLAPVFSSAHVTVFVLVVFFIHIVERVGKWEEPLARILLLSAGFLFLPLARIIASVGENLLFGRTPSWDLRPVELTGLVLALLWILVVGFVWSRWYRRIQLRGRTHL